tara:strand:+ start:918 stop:1556 length:639 start_codon:yes stop_codon:yes gene_type:complete
MRFERKYILSKDISTNIINELLAFGYFNLYPSRIVTSIYYDLPDFSLFHIGEEGNSERYKIRVRFYNNNISSAYLEYKLKKSDSGYKRNYPINNYTDNILINSIGFNSLPIPRQVDSKYLPILGVSYLRFYLMSPCNNIRVTFDSEIKCGKLQHIDDYLNLPFNIDFFNDIMEVKYNSNISSGFSSIQLLLGKFSCTQTKFSKYSTSVKSLY